MEKTKTNEGSFLKALIKINHPDWTDKQIEDEFKRQLEAKLKEEENDDCEACSG